IYLCSIRCTCPWRRNFSSLASVFSRLASSCAWTRHHLPRCFKRLVIFQGPAAAWYTPYSDGIRTDRSGGPSRHTWQYGRSVPITRPFTKGTTWPFFIAFFFIAVSVSFLLKR